MPHSGGMMARWRQPISKGFTASIQVLHIVSAPFDYFMAHMLGRSTAAHRHLRSEALRALGAAVKIRQMEFACRGTPGALSTLGFVLLGLAAVAVVVVPDDGAGLIIAQSVLAGALGGGGVAALAGGNLIASLQKE